MQILIANREPTDAEIWQEYLAIVKASLPAKIKREEQGTKVYWRGMQMMHMAHEINPTKLEEIGNLMQEIQQVLIFQ